MKNYECRVQNIGRFRIGAEFILHFAFCDLHLSGWGHHFQAGVVQPQSTALPRLRRRCNSVHPLHFD